MSEHVPYPPAHERRAGLVVISCGASKTDVPARPRSLYTGTYAQLALAAADNLSRRARTPVRVRILSARHGLIAPDGPPVDPYDATLPERAAQQTWELFWRHRPGGALLRSSGAVVVLAGARYLAAVQALRPDAVRPPAFERARGIGDQQAALGQLRDAADPWSLLGTRVCAAAPSAFGSSSVPDRSR